MPNQDSPLTAEELKAAGYHDEPVDWPSRYPNAAATARGVLNSLPVVGAMVGGAVGSEALGLGSIPGVALGAGAGKGLRDLGMQGLGLEPATDVTDKAKGIATDVGTAAIGQGVLQDIPGAIRAVGNTLIKPAAKAGEFVDPNVIGMVSPRLAHYVRWAQRISKALPGEPPAPVGGPQIQGVPVSVLKKLGIGDDAIEATLRAQEAASNPIRRPEGVGTLLKMTANVAEKAPAVVEAAKEAAPALAQGAEKLKLSSEELIEGVKMLERGMTPDQAMASIKAQREFLTKFKLPSGPEVRASAAERNAVGHWADDPVTGHPKWQFAGQPGVDQEATQVGPFTVRPK